MAARAAALPIEIAVDKADLAAVRTLLSVDASACNAALSREYDLSDFSMATENRDKLLVGKVIHLAVLRKDVRIVKALLESGADPEAIGAVMLFHGFDVLDSGWFREEWTAEEMANHLDIIEVALAIGAHIFNSGGAKDEGRTAEAAERKHRRRRKIKGDGEGKGPKSGAKRMKRRKSKPAIAPVGAGPSALAASAAAAAAGSPDADDTVDVSSVVYNPSAHAARVSPVSSVSGAPRWRTIDESEITLQEAFDSGGFGVIYNAMYAGEAVAVKLMPLPVNLVEDTLLRKQFMKELEALSAANERSDRVCKLYGASMVQNRLCLVMKLYAGCLHDVIDDAPGHRMRTENIVPALMDIALGLRDMHREGIVLRDLKPANCLIDIDAQRVVLADFGLARKVRDTHAGRIGTTTNIAGTPNYAAPECFGEEHLTDRVDIWSFAACAVHMFSGLVPFSNLTIFQIATKLTVKREHPPLPERAPPLLKRLLGECFAFDPPSRPSASQLVDALEAVVAEGQY